MSLTASSVTAQPRRFHGWRADLAYAALAALALLCIHAAGGFARLTDSGGDNDSLLRLVEVRDLIAGQGWFDLHQYRMGPEGGFIMHWSRFVDAPIAAIILAVAAITGSMALGETAAMIAWPTLLMIAALFFLIRGARSLGGERTVFPTLVIGAISLYFLDIFAPGALDHHNVQLVLTLAMLTLLLDASQQNGKGFWAGACAALMLAVGMETAPFAAIAGACVAVSFTVEGKGAQRTAGGFGLGFAAIAAFSFVATVPFDRWFAQQCDAFSLPQMTVAGLGGLGLAAIVSSAAVRAGFGRRLAALGGLAIVIGGVMLIAFPQCLADPYAGIDPRLKTYWLDNVSEAQSLWAMLRATPAMAAGYYATPLVALFWLGRRVFGQGASRKERLVFAFLVATFLVSTWQVRGATFSISIALMPLGCWIAAWREKAEGKVPVSTTLKMLAAWLLSLTVTWSASAEGVSRLLSPQKAVQETAAPSSACEDEAAYSMLGAMPATNVLAVSNIGSAILRYGGHHVLAGPYHRNIDGNLRALSAFMEPSDKTEAIVRDNRITLVAICPGNEESAALTAWAPAGFMAAMRAGKVPAWLEPVAGTAGQPLELYRVLPKP